MTEAASGLERWSALFKDLISSLRDGIFFVLFVLLLFSPATVKDRLIAAGFTKGSIAGMEWEGQIKQSTEQTKAAGEVVAKADDNYQLLIERLDGLEKNAREPALKQSLADLSAEAKNSQSQLAMADKAVKQSLLTQQALVASVAPSAISDRGWLYLGRVSENKDQWAPGSPQTIAPVSLPLQEGVRLSVRDDTYWRADNGGGQHASAPILAVARVGTVVTVEQIDYSHARGGGWFVWVRAYAENRSRS